MDREKIMKVFRISLNVIILVLAGFIVYEVYNLIMAAQGE